jgi:predicted DCC family thiol-disulfide oxidoreductase YuxK
VDQVNDTASDRAGDHRTILLYDRDCGFCRWSLAKILVWDRHRRIRPEALQSPEADRLLAGMDRDRRMASWHLVTPDGRVRSSGEAVPPLLRLLPGGRPLAGMAAAVPGLTDRAYRFVARHRDRLGRMLGERACAVDPGAEEPRDRNPPGASDV